MGDNAFDAAETSGFPRAFNHKDTMSDRQSASFWCFSSPCSRRAPPLSSRPRRQPGARLPLARPPADRRGPARRRGLLVARRQAARVPERARAGQSLLSDLRARPGDRRRQAHLARDRQDDVRVLPAGQRRDPVLVDARTIRSRSSCRTRSSPSGRRARSAATPGTTTRRWTSTRYSEKTGALKRLTDRARLRRRGQLLARRPVDRVLVDARRLRPPAVRRRKEAARARSQLLRRDLHHARRRLRPAAADQRARLRRRTVLHATTARGSSGGASTSRGSSPTSGR